MSTETDERPTNLADALDDVAFWLDAFDGLISMLHKAGVRGFDVDGKYVDLPIDLVGEECQRDLREAARRARELGKNHVDGVVIDAVWPKEQQ